MCRLSCTCDASIQSWSANSSLSYSASNLAPWWYCSESNGRWPKSHPGGRLGWSTRKALRSGLGSNCKVKKVCKQNWRLFTAGRQGDPANYEVPFLCLKAFDDVLICSRRPWPMSFHQSPLTRLPSPGKASLFAPALWSKLPGLGSLQLCFSLCLFS